MTTYTFDTDFTYNDSTKTLAVDKLSTENMSSSGIISTGSYTTSEMNSISSPGNGIIIYNTTENAFYGYSNGAWAEIGSGGGGGGGSYYYNSSVVASVEVNFNSTTAQNLYTVPAGKGLMITGIYARDLTDTPVYSDSTTSPQVGKDVSGTFTGDWTFYNTNLDDGGTTKTFRAAWYPATNGPGSVLTNQRAANPKNKYEDGDVLQFKCGALPDSGGCTGIVDIIGYIYTIAEPVANADIVGITRVASATLDMTNTSTAQNIYTVPAGKVFICTQVVARSFTDAYTTNIDIRYDDSAFYIRFNGAVIDDGTVGYSYNSIGFNITAIGGCMRMQAGAAGQVMNTTLTVAGAGTAVIDVFGYLIDA